MNKNFKYKNTIVIGFDDIDDPKRKQLTDLLSKGLSEGWCLFLADRDVVTDEKCKRSDEES